MTVKDESTQLCQSRLHRQSGDPVLRTKVGNRGSSYGLMRAMREHQVTPSPSIPVCLIWSVGYRGRWDNVKQLGGVSQEGGGTISAEVHAA